MKGNEPGEQLGHARMRLGREMRTTTQSSSKRMPRASTISTTAMDKDRFTKGLTGDPLLCSRPFSRRNGVEISHQSNLLPVSGRYGECVAIT